MGGTLLIVGALLIILALLFPLGQSVIHSTDIVLSVSAKLDTEYEYKCKEAVWLSSGAHIF